MEGTREGEMQGGEGRKLGESDREEDAGEGRRAGGTVRCGV